MDASVHTAPWVEGYTPYHHENRSHRAAAKAGGARWNPELNRWQHTKKTGRGARYSNHGFTTAPTTVDMTAAYAKSHQFEDLSNAADYVDWAFNSDPNLKEHYVSVEVTVRNAHISALEYNTELQVLLASFATGDKVAYFRVPMLIWTQLYNAAISGTTTTNTYDGNEHSFVGVKFWDYMRLRGRREGSKFSYAYMSRYTSYYQGESDALGYTTKDDISDFTEDDLDDLFNDKTTRMKIKNADGRGEKTVDYWQLKDGYKKDIARALLNKEKKKSASSYLTDIVNMLSDEGKQQYETAVNDIEMLYNSGASDALVSIKNILHKYGVAGM